VTVLDVIHLPTGGIVAAVTRVAQGATTPSVADLVGKSLPLRWTETRAGDGDIARGAITEIELDAALLAVTEIDPTGLDLDSLLRDPTLFRVTQEGSGEPARIVPGPALTVESVSLSSTTMTVRLSGAADTDLPVLARLSQRLVGESAPSPITVVSTLRKGRNSVGIRINLAPGGWDGVAFVAGLAPVRFQATVGGVIN